MRDAKVAAIGLALAASACTPQPQKQDAEIAVKTEAEAPPAVEPVEDGEVSAAPPGSGTTGGETETGGEPEPEPEPVNAENPGSLAHDIVAWAAPAPALLTWNAKGLQATDGKRVRTLAELELEVATYDPGLRVVWAVGHHTLWALDLAAAADAEPIAVAEALPDDVSVSLPDANLAWLGAMRVPEFLELRWEPAPKLDVGLSFGEVMNEDVVAKLEAVKLVADTWLESLAKRAKSTVPKAITATTIAGVPTCDDWEACGKAVPWPNTSWVIYVDSYDCGDYCYWSCSVFDTKTGFTADPASLPAPVWNEDAEPMDGACDTYHVDARQTAMVINGALCRGTDCSKLRGRVLGFLDPGPTLVAGPA